MGLTWGESKIVRIAIVFAELHLYDTGYSNDTVKPLYPKTWASHQKYSAITSSLENSFDSMLNDA